MRDRASQIVAKEDVTPATAARRAIGEVRQLYYTTSKKLEEAIRKAVTDKKMTIDPKTGGVAFAAGVPPELAAVQQEMQAAEFNQSEAKYAFDMAVRRASAK
jgi:hypothetical protein